MGILGYLWSESIFRTDKEGAQITPNPVDCLEIMSIAEWTTETWAGSLPDPRNWRSGYPYAYRHRFPRLNTEIWSEEAKYALSAHIFADFPTVPPAANNPFWRVDLQPPQQHNNASPNHPDTADRAIEGLALNVGSEAFSARHRESPGGPCESHFVDAQLWVPAGATTAEPASGERKRKATRWASTVKQCVLDVWTRAVLLHTHQRSMEASAAAVPSGVKAKEEFSSGSSGSSSDSIDVFDDERNLTLPLEPLDAVRRAVVQVLEVFYAVAQAGRVPPLDAWLAVAQFCARFRRLRLLASILHAAALSHPRTPPTFFAEVVHSALSPPSGGRKGKLSVFLNSTDDSKKIDEVVAENAQVPLWMRTRARCDGCGRALSGEEIVSGWRVGYVGSTCPTCGSSVKPYLQLALASPAIGDPAQTSPKLGENGAWAGEPGQWRLDLKTVELLNPMVLRDFYRSLTVDSDKPEGGEPGAVRWGWVDPLPSVRGRGMRIFWNLAWHFATLPLRNVKGGGSAGSLPLHFLFGREASCWDAMARFAECGAVAETPNSILSRVMEAAHSTSWWFERHIYPESDWLVIRRGIAPGEGLSSEPFPPPLSSLAPDASPPMQVLAQLDRLVTKKHLREAAAAVAMVRRTASEQSIGRDKQTEPYDASISQLIYRASGGHSLSPDLVMNAIENVARDEGKGWVWPKDAGSTPQLVSDARLALYAFSQFPKPKKTNTGGQVARLVAKLGLPPMTLVPTDNVSTGQPPSIQMAAKDLECGLKIRERIATSYGQELEELLGVSLREHANDAMERAILRHASLRLTGHLIGNVGRAPDTPLPRVEWLRGLGEETGLGKFVDTVIELIPTRGGASNDSAAASSAHDLDRGTLIHSMERLFYGHAGDESQTALRKFWTSVVRAIAAWKILCYLEVRGGIPSEAFAGFPRAPLARSRSLMLELQTRRRTSRGQWGRWRYSGWYLAGNSSTFRITSRRKAESMPPKRGMRWEPNVKKAEGKKGSWIVNECNTLDGWLYLVVPSRTIATKSDLKTPLANLLTSLKFAANDSEVEKGESKEWGKGIRIRRWERWMEWDENSPTRSVRELAKRRNNYVRVEIFEQQREYVGTGWSARVLPGDGYAWAADPSCREPLTLLHEGSPLRTPPEQAEAGVSPPPNMAWCEDTEWESIPISRFFGHANSLSRSSTSNGWMYLHGGARRVRGWFKVARIARPGERIVPAPLPLRRSFSRSSRARGDLVYVTRSKKKSAGDLLRVFPLSDLEADKLCDMGVECGSSDRPLFLSLAQRVAVAGEDVGMAEIALLADAAGVSTRMGGVGTEDNHAEETVLSQVDKLGRWAYSRDRQRNFLTEVREKAQTFVQKTCSDFTKEILAELIIGNSSAMRRQHVGSLGSEGKGDLLGT